MGERRIRVMRPFGDTGRTTATDLPHPRSGTIERRLVARGERSDVVGPRAVGYEREEQQDAGSDDEVASKTKGPEARRPGQDRTALPCAAPESYRF